jgi:hypothetical protein
MQLPVLVVCFDWNWLYFVDWVASGCGLVPDVGQQRAIRLRKASPAFLESHLLA